MTARPPRPTNPATSSSPSPTSTSGLTATPRLPATLASPTAVRLPTPPLATSPPVRPQSPSNTPRPPVSLSGSRGSSGRPEPCASPSPSPANSGSRPPGPPSTVASHKHSASLTDLQEPPPRSKSGIVLRRMGGISKSFKDNTMSVDVANLGVCTFSERPTTINLKQSLVQVNWVWEDKTGQKFQISIIDKANVEVLQVPSASELDKWIQALQGHGCVISRPIKMYALNLLKKRDPESWGVLYPDHLQFFKKKSDSKPTSVIMISDGSLVERLDQDSFCLHETWDEGAASLSCSGDSAWCEAVEQAVHLKYRKKSQNSLKEGYLLKWENGWKRRYLVLLSDQMRYYKKRSDDVPEGVIMLPPGAEAEKMQADPSDSLKRLQFWVAENGDEIGTRRHDLVAHSEAEKNAWLQSLHNLFATKDDRVNRNSLREGYLFKLSKSNKNRWSKKYFILEKDALKYYRKRTDVAQKGSIDLNQGAELFAINPTRDTTVLPGLFSLAENGDETGTRTYILRATDNAKRAEWLTILNAQLKERDVRVNPRSVKEGYMRKLAGQGGKWNKRYFVLTQHNLVYYRKRGDKVEAGEIPLPGSAEVTRIEDDKTQEPWQFSVAENGDEVGTRTYFMSCASAEIRTQWMGAMSKIIKAKDAKIMIGSILEGYLWKRPDGGGTWRKFYFVLKTNQLLYFKKRQDETEAGSVEIKGEAEVFCIDDDEEHSYVFSVAKNGDEGERTWKLCAHDENTRYEWVQKLRQQAALLAVKEVPDSVREGYVFVWSSSAWRKRYFILESKPGSLTLFNKRKDLKPASKLSLDGSTVAVLLDNKIPPHGSAWGAKHDQPDTKEELPGPPDELKGQPEGDEDDLDDHRGAGLSFVVCQNGDANAKHIRLKGASVSDAVLVSDIMEICITKEFPPANDILKSGYLVARYKATGIMKADRWLSSYVTLTKERLSFFKSHDDEFPASSCTLDQAKFYMGPVSGSAAWNGMALNVVDKTEREISFTAQSKEEKTSWSVAIVKAIVSLREGREPARAAVFGADLKASFTHSNFYAMPSVITQCVEFLRKAPLSGCLLRHPGFHPLIRSFIQDFEFGLETPLTDTDSVAACLKFYLMMLKRALVEDKVAKLLADVLSKKRQGVASAHANNEKYVVNAFHKIISGLDAESAISLRLVLHYLWDEIRDRPEEVELTLEHVVSTWSPLLIRYHEGADDIRQQILTVLLRNLETLWPGGAPVPCRRLMHTKLLQVRKESKELTFDQLYRDKYGMELFQRFVKENYLEENVLFLAATQQYRDMCSNAAHTATQCLAAALLICATYIKAGAEVQVNVGSTLSSAVLAQFEDPKSSVRSKPLTGNEFLEVEQEATMLIQTNAFPRFRQSEHWDHWITYRHLVENAKRKHAVAEPVEEESLEPVVIPEQKTSEGEFEEKMGEESKREAPTSEEILDRVMPPAASTSEEILDRVMPPAESDPPNRLAPTPNSTGHYATMPRASPSLSKPLIESEEAAKLIKPETADAPPPTSEGALPPPSANEEIYFKRKSPNKGISYYINVASKQTSWKMPTTGIIYSCLLDDAGRAYFVNVRDKTSTWDTPDCLKDFVEVYKII